MLVAAAIPSPSCVRIRCICKDVSVYTCIIYFPEERPDIKLIGRIKYRSGSDIKRYRPVNDIGRFFEEIARALNVNEACIANAKGKNDAAAAANEVVRAWLDSDVDATWEKLIDAMEVKEELNQAIKQLKTALLNMVK